MFLAFNISDIIRIPFGYVLDFLYQLTTNYGVALILFAIIVRLVLIPVNAKSKKSMMKTAAASWCTRSSRRCARRGGSSGSKMRCANALRPESDSWGPRKVC